MYFKIITAEGDHLVSMSGFIPKEFARRKPRPLEDLARFKATEFHFILNHAGPIIFIGCMPDALYTIISLFFTPLSTFLELKSYFDVMVSLIGARIF